MDVGFLDCIIARYTVSKSEFDVGVSCRGLSGIFFLQNECGRAITVSVTSQRYADTINTLLALELAQFPSNEPFWLQQDDSTFHCARISRETLHRLFGNRIISRNGDI